MTIKHLVFSGGGPSLFQTLGSIQHVAETKFIDLNTIETIYGTSAGAIIGALICLKYDWQTIYDYMIKRPWHDVFNINIQQLLDIYTKKGLYGMETIQTCFKPLLDAKDMSLDITLKELYEYSKIELHMFTFEINNFQTEDISYLTHPNLSLITALQMTCCLPFIITPVCMDGKCYIDGGIFCNYPLKYCIASGKPEQEILGIKTQYDNETKNNVDNNSTILDFILCFLFNIINRLIDKQTNIKNEIITNTNKLSIDGIRMALSSLDTRKTLYNAGIEYAKKFLEDSI